MRIATEYHTIQFVENGKNFKQNVITKYIDIKDYKFDKSNVNILVGIAHHFSKDAGIDINQLYKKDFSVGSIDDIGENWPVLTNLHNDPGSGLGELMSSNKQLNRLNITLNNGKLDPKLNDATNFTSTLFHEKTHLDTEDISVWEHLDVYFKQISHKSWKKTTGEYKDLMVSNVKELLSTAKGGNNKLSKEDNKKIIDLANEWESAFKQKLGKDFERHE